MHPEIGRGLNRHCGKPVLLVTELPQCSEEIVSVATKPRSRSDKVALRTC